MISAALIAQCPTYDAKIAFTPGFCPQVYNQKDIASWKSFQLTDADIKSTAVYAKIRVWSGSFIWTGQPIPKIGGICFPKAFALKNLIGGEEGKDITVRWSNVTFRFRCAQMEITPDIRFQDWITMQNTISYIMKGPDVYFASYDFTGYVFSMLEKYVSKLDYSIPKDPDATMSIEELFSLYSALHPYFKVWFDHPTTREREDRISLIRKTFQFCNNQDRTPMSSKDCDLLMDFVSLFSLDRQKSGVREIGIVKYHMQIQRLLDGIAHFLKAEKALLLALEAIDNRRACLVQLLSNFFAQSTKQLTKTKDAGLWLHLYKLSTESGHFLHNLHNVCVNLAKFYPPFLKVYEVMNSEESLAGLSRTEQIREKIAEAKKLNSLVVLDRVQKFLSKQN